MHPDLQALLKLQADDDALDALEGRRQALDERERALDQVRTELERGLQRTRAALTDEEARERELRQKIDDHKALQARSQSHLEAAKKQRDAAAAWAELDLARRVLATEEGELKGIGARVRDERQAAAAREQQLTDLAEEQREAREAIAADRARLEEELAAARQARAALASRVSRGTLGKYERLRNKRHATSLFKIDGSSCSNCHTAIPMQRRKALQDGQSIDTCESCGVLLYATV